MAAGALDAGSRVILVLSGLTNKLHNQTQARLQSDLIDHNADRLYTPTAEDDLSRYRPGDEKSERNWSWLKAACRNHLLADDGHAIVLAVKKNIATRGRSGTGRLPLEQRVAWSATDPDR